MGREILATSFPNAVLRRTFPIGVTLIFISAPRSFGPFKASPTRQSHSFDIIGDNLNSAGRLDDPSVGRRVERSQEEMQRSPS